MNIKLNMICVLAWIYISIFLKDVSTTRRFDFQINSGTISYNQLGQYRSNSLKALWKLDNINKDAMMFNRIAASLAWQSSTASDQNVDIDINQFTKARTKWRQNVCRLFTAIRYEDFTDSLKRQAYLFCRGPTFNEHESRSLSVTLNELQAIYTETQICVRTKKDRIHIEAEDDKSTEFISKNFAGFLQSIKYEIFEAGFSDRDLLMEVALMESTKINDTLGDFGEGNVVNCYRGEPDLERLMAECRDEEVLRFAWLAWRESVGPPMKSLYTDLVKVENAGARRNGYKDIGQAWREELEVPDLKKMVEQLFDEIKPFYTALHGVARFFLNRYYGDSVVPNSGPIPAHVLGNMWSQNWGSIIDLILPISKNHDLEARIKKTNWTTIDMVKHAEDFYFSMGLPKMTEKFWKYSYFKEKDNIGNERNKMKCHGTAANMFQENDYRMIYCARLSMVDYYVVHHEMGHIQYYMAYKDLPVVFQDGTNSAFQESIGDAIMYGVLSPPHLHRVGLIEDESLYYNTDARTAKYKSRNDFGFKEGKEIFESVSSARGAQDDMVKASFDEILLLKQAFDKIPQISFGLILDKYRWKIFSGEIEESNYNEEFWKLLQKYQGIMAPDGHARGEKYFDAAAKFHIPDNTPYVRYFLSSFVQIQMFRGLCAAVIGSGGASWARTQPLHRCDLYGSKAAGNKLREMMSKGSSIRWDEALQIVSGEDRISSDALLQYFEPLNDLLSRLIKEYNIDVGW